MACGPALSSQKFVWCNVYHNEKSWEFAFPLQSSHRLCGSLAAFIRVCVGTSASSSAFQVNESATNFV